MSANEIRASFAFPFVINRLKHYFLSRGTISLPKATPSCKVISAFKLRSVFTFNDNGKCDLAEEKII